MTLKSLPFVALLLVLASVWFLTGCATPLDSPLLVVSPYKPSNIYRPTPFMPASVRRVAVLPVTIEERDWQAEEGRTEVSPVLHAELGKVKVFERVIVTPDQLKELTGQRAWRAEEQLPANFFERLREVYGCDAVLFSHLRPYHAYKPLVVGWNFRLVEAQRHTIIWAADEVFDAAKPAVAKAALCYWQDYTQLIPTELDTAGVLVSPRRFSQYTLCALLETLPSR
jgi:hypothetical protein